MNPASTSAAPAKTSPIHQDAIHDSAYRHVAGTARYVDDWPLPRGCLHAWVFRSPVAAGRLDGLDLDQARSMPGVVAIYTARDIPGENLIGPIIHDEPLLVADEISYHGQPLAVIVAETAQQARQACARIKANISAEAPILGIPAAIAANSFIGQPHTIARGNVAEALNQADLVIRAEASTPAQDHFYLETQASLVWPLEDGNWHVLSSSQHPTEVQKLVAHILDLPANKVVCEVPRMGGGFGGKESQAAPFACMAALAAYHTGRPVKLRLDREADMTITGTRHPFYSRYAAGFSKDGQLQALEVDIYSDGGYSSDLSLPVMDRALFHLDNAYFIPKVRFTGRVCRTNTASNTAFRGFGGPQGAFVVEDAMNRAAEVLGLDSLEIRQKNFYGAAPRDRTHYGQEVANNRLDRIASELLESSDYQNRKKAIAEFNASSRHIRRGIAFQPCKFGISFTKSFLNQAGALVLVYSDGSVQLNHGGTEMGQGLHAKMRAVAAHELGLDVDAIRIMNTATDKVPNTSATAASSGSDLNGQAVRAACRSIIERMKPVAARLLDSNPDSIEFRGSRVYAGEQSLSFSELATQCWLAQVSLSATGYYRTPGIVYDESIGRGTPFFYFAFGGAIVEVELCALTGESRVLRADILHDAGNSLIPSLDRGQVEGGFVQSMGWLTTEEVLRRPDGSLITTGPSTYNVPSCGDAPLDLRLALLENAPEPGVIHGSKAVGEPPYLLGIAVISALRQAIASFSPKDQPRPVELAIPATAEAILRAIENQKQSKE